MAQYATTIIAQLTNAANLPDLSDNTKVSAMLVRTSGTGSGPYYTIDTTATGDAFLSDIPDNTDCRASDVVLVTNPTVTGNDPVFDFDSISFGVVAAGDAIQKVVFFYDTGTEGTSRLISVRNPIASGSITPDGTAITITPHADGATVFDLP